MEGGAKDLADAIKEKRWRELARLTDRECALCEVAEKLSGDPTKMVPEDWDDLRAMGFDDQDCLEVGHVVGVFNYLTRMADGFGLRLDPETEEAAGSDETLRRPDV